MKKTTHFSFISGLSPVLQFFQNKVILKFMAIASKSPNSSLFWENFQPETSKRAFKKFDVIWFA